jgi:glycine/D-amino acid oxidase-like deaminating enzyme
MYQFDTPVKSYWEHVTSKKKKYDTLEKNVSANIVVMGGGYTGISCALQLVKEYDEDVILLEAGHIGWGSSARNAGFLCIPAAKMSIEKMIKLHGIDETKKFYADTIEGSLFTKALIDVYKIDCDVTGNCNYEVAHHPVFFDSIKETAEIYNKEFGIETKVYSKEEFREIGHGGNEQYGALSYKPGFAINPLKFLLGLAETAASLGVKIYKHSQVLKIEKNLGKYKIFTKNFSVTANKIVMATNGFYKDDLLPDFNDRILPAISNIIVTRPLTSDELASHNYSTRNPVLNSRNLLYYYRLLKDNRFLFGARGDLIGSNASSDKMSKKMEQQMKKVFPNWTNVKIDFRWRGLVAVTTKFTPSIGKLENDEIYYSFGYHANGVNTAPWAGKELANLIMGSNTKKIQISKLYLGLPKKFPLPFLRLVYLRLAYLYYNFIDK